MGRHKKVIATTLEDTETIEVDTTTTSDSGTTNPIIESNHTPTVKEELEALHAEMVRLGVNSIGQVEVKINQQK